MAYPVTFDVERPAVFQRAQAVLRIALLIILGWVGLPIGLLWLGIPVASAVLIGQNDGKRYLDEDGPVVIRSLGWVVGAVAYLALLTDRLSGGGESPIRFEVDRSGTPTVGSALLRILTSIPSLVVLGLLSFVGAFVWLIGLVWVVVGESYPESLWGYLRGLVRWEVYLLAYLASVVDVYPPFALDTGPAPCAV